MEIWRSLRPLRKNAGLTLEQVAVAIGASHGHLSKAERGGGSLSIEMFEAYLSVVGARLAVVTDSPGDTVVITSVPEDRRVLVQQLADVLPHLPDSDADTLAATLRYWRARYVTITDSGKAGI